MSAPLVHIEIVGNDRPALQQRRGRRGPIRPVTTRPGPSGSRSHRARPTRGRSERYSFYHPWTYAPGESLYVIPRWDYSFNAGGGNLLSNVSDLTAFGIALMEPGFLSGESAALRYSDPWFGAAATEEPMIVMTGSNPGVQAGLAIDPGGRITTAVLANTWSLGSRSAEMVMLARKLTNLRAERS